MNKICLVVIFNHRFDENLIKLDRLYQDKFANIKYLMPFYTGAREDVIAVYESSEVFQGYIAQAYRELYHKSFTHYVFAADDLILNPGINEGNILNALNLAADSGYISSFNNLADVNFQRWPHALKGIATFSNICYKCCYCNYAKELPPYETALQLMRRHGLDDFTLTAKNLTKNGDSANLGTEEYSFPGQICNIVLFNKIKQLCLTNKSFGMPYPLVRGYSDFVVVPAAALQEFSRLCGIFAAMRLFVEVALPTALLLSCSKVGREENGSFPGLCLWEEAEKHSLHAAHCGSIDSILNFLQLHNYLYIHPVKLSMWR